MQLRVRQQQRRTRAPRAFSLRERWGATVAGATVEGLEVEASLRVRLVKGLDGTRRGPLFEFQTRRHPNKHVGGIFFEC